MTTAAIQIDETIARKVLTLIDRGLSKGLGNAKPGAMCIEAVVCNALGLPHGDDPVCVSRALRSLKINLNDRDWSSKAARAKGLRRLGVAQLGSRDHLDDKEFAKRVAELAIRTCVPQALRSAASIQKNSKHQQALRDAADKCEREPTEANSRKARSAAYAAATGQVAVAADAAAAYAADAAAGADAAYAAAYGAKKDARDESLADFAEGVVQILIEMKAPGCEWLFLTEAS